MTYEELDKLRREQPEGFNRLAAERIHGQKPPEGTDQQDGEWGHIRDAGGNAWWFEHCWPARFGTDVSADYATLMLARGTWDAQQIMRMRDCLTGIWNERYDDRAVIVRLSMPMRYEPGDYTHAALVALLVTPGDSGGGED